MKYMIRIDCGKRFTVILADNARKRWQIARSLMRLGVPRAALTLTESGGGMG